MMLRLMASYDCHHSEVHEESGEAVGASDEGSAVASEPEEVVRWGHHFVGEAEVDADEQSN